MGDYSYAQKITVDHTKVSETDAEFAVALILDDTGSSIISDLATVGNGGRIENTANGGASGSYTVPADLTFRTTADLTEAGASLDFEIELYRAISGALVAWVQCGVNSGTDVVFYMIYGNSDVVTSQENVAGTWDTHFKGVYHLREVSGTIYDSTANGHDGVASGNMPTQAQGRIQKCQSFDGNGDWIDLPQLMSNPTEISMMGWFNMDNTSDDYRPLVHDNVEPYIVLRFNQGGANKLDTYIYTDAGAHILIDNGLTLTNWNHIAVTAVEGGAAFLFSNGNQADTDATLGNFLTLGSGAVVIGTGRLYSAFNQDFPGDIDEVRFSDIARSANWIATVYANQNSPDTFYAIIAVSLTHEIAGVLTYSGEVRGKALKHITGVILYSGALSILAGLLYQAVAGVLTFIGSIASRVLRGAGADYEYRIDTTTEDMDNVEILLGVAPAGVRFRYHSVIQQSGIGVSGGSGYPQCEWAFDYLSWASLAVMLAFLGGNESVGLYINTRRPDNTFGLYSAIMHRPHVPGEATQIIGGWRNVTFKFTHLEVA